MPRTRRAPDPHADLVTKLRELKGEKRVRKLATLNPMETESLDASWPTWAHEGQRPPHDDWRVWVIMAGRGFGKTMAGAQWLTAQVRDARDVQVALVAATIEEGRQVMVEGRSGLLRVAAPWVDDWNPTRGILRFKGGVTATLFSGASPDKLRGPEHHFAWCDELAKWAHPRETWDNLLLGLRLGDRPRTIVTTTPRPGPVLRRIMDEPGCVRTGGGTRDNPHTAPSFKETVTALFAGTRVGAQELDGQLLPESGALWTPEVLERCRLLDPPRASLKEGDRRATWRDGGGAVATEAVLESVAPDATTPPPPAQEGGHGSRSASRLRSATCPRHVADRPTPPSPSGGGSNYVRTLIGVDPPTGDGTCGIVACAVDADGVGHVLADHSVSGRSPDGWAGAVADAARVHGMRVVVAERNQGGRMVETVLRAANAGLHVRLVHASEGKAARAQPIALLFEAGRVRLHGRFPELEAELLGLAAGAPYQGPGGSPDRADAMVWALTALMLDGRAEPRVSML